MSQFDLIVIGAGAAGSTCAEQVNETGKRIALIEREALGGTCLNYGCDPTKAALHAAKILHYAQQGAAYGLNTSNASVAWPEFQAHIQATVQKVRGGSRETARKEMRERGIELVMGEARFVSVRKVEVNGRILQADHILIATGMQAVVPDIQGLAESGYVTSKQILDLPCQPRRLAIAGGGPIGVEFAQLFARLGSQVFLFESEPHILPQDDPELADGLASILEKEGVKIFTEAKITAVSSDNSGKEVAFSGESEGQDAVAVDELLIAVGRKATIDALNLEAAGITVTDGQIQTNATLQTNVPHIWAAGDVSNDYPFTHMAWRQGEHIAQMIIDNEERPFTPGPVPWVTYTDPELAHVGKTEAQLKEANTPYSVHTLPLSQVARAIVTGEERGCVKLLIGEDEKILGGHILASNGGEIVAPIILAMKAGIAAKTLARTVWPYPTMSAAVGQVVEEGKV